MSEFVHLHQHSQYSILDGISTTSQIVDQTIALGMDTSALTDHGNLHGSIDFYKKCKEKNVKPILGMEAYVTLDPDYLDKKEYTKDNVHLVLLAKNNEGWHDLIWLSSQAYLHNFYYKPRVSWNNLKTHTKNLIACTACLGGPISRSGKFIGINKKGEELYRLPGETYKDWNQRAREIISGKFEDPEGRAHETALALRDIFKDRLYLEIQDHNMWEQIEYNKFIINLAKKENIPLVITADTHYPTKEDYRVFTMVQAQQRKKTLKEFEEELISGHGDDLYIKSKEEMWESAKKWKAEDAFHNTKKIADQCNVEIELGKYQIPDFDITKCDDYEEFLEWQKY